MHLAHLESATTVPIGQLQPDDWQGSEHDLGDSEGSPEMAAFEKTADVVQVEMAVKLVSSLAV